MRNLNGHLVDGVGAPLTLQGVNLSGLEYAPIQGYGGTLEWGGQLGTSSGVPDFSAMASWKINTIRIPLNEASWRGGTCVDVLGAQGPVGGSVNVDPSGQYHTAVTNAINAATAAGFFVILDLHWTAPSNFCPLDQNIMADSVNSVAFWKSVSATYKSYPNVIFELFNEPYSLTDTQLRDGAAVSIYSAQGPNGAQYQAYSYNYQTAGWNQLIQAVRGTGASNLILAGTTDFSGDISQWLANKPTDVAPAGYAGAWTSQVGAAIHPYPTWGASWGTAAYNVPKDGGDAVFGWLSSIIAAGFPVVATEYGDHSAPGTVGAPNVSHLLPNLDAIGASYIGWVWDPLGAYDFDLAKDASGTPTDGFGAYTKSHYVCRASGASNCP